MQSVLPMANDRPAARFRLVDKHIRRENAHDLDGVMATFGEQGSYEDEPWGEHHDGLAEVRRYYETLMAALRDLEIDVKRRFTSADAVAYEVVISGTHLGDWRAIPATGRQLRFPLVAIYTFTAEDRLAGERIFYDRATVLRQLGLFHEPDRFAGRMSMALTHPWTIAHAFARQLRAWIRR